MNIDTLVHAGWIIPVEPAKQVFEDYSLAIHEGVILELLPTREAKKKYQPRVSHQLDEHVLIPGLINAHTHAAMTLFRGMADDLPLMTWLNEHIWPAEQQMVDTRFVYDGTQHAMAEMIRSGTTCFNDMYFFPDQTAHAADMAGIRAVVGMIVIDFPSAWAKNVEDYFLKGEEVHDTYRHHALIKTTFAPHAPYTVSDEPLKKIAMLAEELNVPIHMHLHETTDEIDQQLKISSERPLERMERLGILSDRLLAVHMTQLNKADIERINKFAVHVVHCPESNLKLASGFCPVYELDQSNINLCLGTDGNASNNDLDMIGEMRSAALLAKGVSANAEAIPAYKALEMATINAAKALEMENEIGSLVPGKQADITAIRLNSIESRPLYDPISQIVYSGSREQVTDVWVAGNQLLRNRKLLTLDEEAILKKTQGWQTQLQAFK